jgi:hypothetical protein
LKKERDSGVNSSTTSKGLILSSAKKWVRAHQEAGPAGHGEVSIFIGTGQQCLFHACYVGSQCHCLTKAAQRKTYFRLLEQKLF